MIMIMVPEWVLRLTLVCVLWFVRLIGGPVAFPIAIVHEPGRGPALSGVLGSAVKTPRHSVPSAAGVRSPPIRVRSKPCAGLPETLRGA